MRSEWKLGGGFVEVKERGWVVEEMVNSGSEEMVNIVGLRKECGELG